MCRSEGFEILDFVVACLSSCTSFTDLVLTGDGRVTGDGRGVRIEIRSERRYDVLKTKRGKKEENGNVWIIATPIPSSLQLGLHTYLLMTTFHRGFWGSMKHNTATITTE